MLLSLLLMMMLSSTSSAKICRKWDGKTPIISLEFHCPAPFKGVLLKTDVAVKLRHERDKYKKLYETSSAYEEALREASKQHNSALVDFRLQAKDMEIKELKTQRMILIGGSVVAILVLATGAILVQKLH